MDGSTLRVAMLNQKGGVGKTTTTVNLGHALARAGRRVCLIDLDPQAHLTLHLGVDPDDIDHTVYDLLLDPACEAHHATITARENLDAILAEVDLAAAETELTEASDRLVRLRDKFTDVNDQYDVVLIDCPPSLGLLTLNALSMVDHVFMPMQAHFLALQGVGKLLETVGLVSQQVNESLRVSGVILCMHESQTTLAREVVTDLDAFFDQAREQDVPWRDCQVLKPAIRRNIKLAEAPSFGNTIFDYESNCPGARDYHALAQNVINMMLTIDSTSTDADQSDATDRASQSSSGEDQAAAEIVTMPAALHSTSASVSTATHATEHTTETGESQPSSARSERGRDE